MPVVGKHAPTSQQFGPIRAVLTVSFERIHRANPIGMGILPLLLASVVRSQAVVFCVYGT